VTNANRKRNARAQTEKGDRALREAEVLLAAGLCDGAVSRAYYAAFHYARALLLSEGLQPRSHRGVGALITERFVATGRLTRETGALLSRLETIRTIADYGVEEAASAERAAAEVAEARRFVSEVRAALQVGGWLE
jgi:hypothetical protein